MPSRVAASVTLISPGASGPGVGILWTWRTHWTASTSNGRPLPVRCPAALSRVTRSSLLVVGPSARISSTTGAGVAHGGADRRPGPVGGDLVGGAGVPADPDPDLGPVGLGEHGDVGDQGAQQPFAVPRGGGVGVPEPGQVADQGLQVGPGGQRWGGVAGGRQRRLGLGEGGQAGLPAGFEGADDQPVLRFGGVEGPLGPVGVVAGAFHGQLGGPARPGAAVGDLVGGGEGERDLVGVQRGQQPFGHDLVDRVGGHRPAGRGGLLILAGVAFVGAGAVAVIAGGHRPPAAAAADDALTQRVALAGRAGAGVGAVGRDLRLVAQVVLPAQVAGVVVADQDLPLVHR